MRILQCILTGLFLTLAVNLCKAETAYFDYNPAIQSCYQKLLHLQFEEASHDLAMLARQEPDNLALIHLENYADFYQIFILEDREVFERQSFKKKERIREIESKASQSDPYTAFVIAEIHLQWALARLKFEEYLKAANELYTAYQLLQENAKMFPDFSLNMKSLSIIHSLIQSIPLPDIVKDLGGLSGTIDQGLAEISALLRDEQYQDQFWHQEAEAIYLSILFFQAQEKEQAILYLEDSAIASSEDPVSLFLRCTLLQKSGRNDEVIDLLDSYLKDHIDTPFIYLYFMLGSAKLNRLDTDANDMLSKYVQDFQGQHYIKEAYQKLAWHSLVQANDIPGYKKHMHAVLQHGKSVIDGDKQAESAAMDNEMPHPVLLKARLLYDGGYYNEAYILLIKEAAQFYQETRFYSDYFYRLGRVTQALDNYSEAIDYYSTLLDDAEGTQDYRACNAALQCGIIYEKQGKVDMAKEYYTVCLSIKPKVYRSSIHQKAKSGLVRLAQ